MEYLSLNAAVVRVQPLSRKPGHVGALAFSRSLDPTTGGLSDEGDQEIRRRAGRFERVVTKRIACAVRRRVRRGLAVDLAERAR